MSDNYTEKLRSFLDVHKVEGNENPISHVSLTGGKWSIPLNKNEEFLTYYCGALKENKRKLYLAECFLPGKKIKLVLDIEIRPDHITGDIPFEKIEYEILPKITNTMTELLREKLCIENEEYVISSRAPYLYHINFPNVVLGIKTVKNLILICREIMEKHYQYINWNKSIDTEIYSVGKGLRMLGSYSRKEILKAENPFYRVLKNNSPEQYLDITLTHLLNTSIRTEIDDDEIRNITSHQSELVRYEEEIDNHDEIISSYIDEIRPQFKTLGLQVSKIKKLYYGNIDQPYFVVNLKDRLCPFVQREHRRKSDYLYIFITKNGSCLRCYNEECKDHKFPDKLMKINTTIKNKYYQSFEPPKREEEIPEGYELTEEVTQLIEKCLIEITHYDLATLVYIIYKDKFRVDTFSSSGSRTTWYEFKNHRFYADSNHLGILISEDLIYYFKKYKKDICGGTNLVIDDLVKKLKTVSFKNSVLVEASNIFYDRHPEFVSLMDTKKNLICFNNGVYDLETLEFRNGRIEDYITLSTRNEFLEYDPEHPKIKEIIQFFREVFVNPDSREYMLKKIALSLSGRGQEEFHIWTGNGCHSKGTEILMYDGTIKKVEDIVISDVLMGDDSTPRNVLQLFRGHSDMYEICPVKGESFTVNGDHILSLKITETMSLYYREERKTWNLKWMEYDEEKIVVNHCKSFETREQAMEFKKKVLKKEKIVKNGDIIDVSVKKYLQNKSRIGERNLFLYKNRLEFEYKKVDINPYILGYWLGDGHSNTPAVTTMDKEVVDYFDQELGNDYNIKISSKENNKAKTYYIAGKTRNDTLMSIFRKYKLINNKHIPIEYKTNSRDVRLKLLAGIIDSDGHYQKKCNQYEINLKSESLIDDVIYLARSLGFACYKKKKKTSWSYKGEKKFGECFTIFIVGEGIEEIPVKLERKVAEKRKKNKDVSRVGFTIKKVEDDNFYGFELDGNHRYFMANFFITHNSNGKSRICELIKLAFGDYWNEMPVALITKPRNSSSSPSPEVMDLKGRRISTIQEPEMKDRLNMGLVKQFTGNDTISARQLHKKQEKFTLQTHLFLCCNVIPKIECSDGGTWRRIKIVEFKSKFVDNPDPDKDHEFKKDPFLDKKMASWGPCFLSLLIHYYKLAIKEGVKEPAEVKEFTQEFRKDSDFFAQFVDDCLLDDGKSITKFIEIFNVFENWCVDNNIRTKIYTKTEIKKLLKDLFGSEKAYKIGDDYIKGFRVAIKKPESVLSDEE